MAFARSMPGIDGFLIRATAGGVLIMGLSAIGATGGTIVGLVSLAAGALGLCLGRAPEATSPGVEPFRS